MRFTILSLFPEFFETPLACALMGKAREKGLVDFQCIDPRAFTTDKHRTVDDRPYGGGPGMVMLPEPLDKALSSIETPGRKLVMAPSGRPLTQEFAAELAHEPALTLICGRYEGIDARLVELHSLEPVSVGDFVLGGGEAAALCVIESVSRLLEGFMGHSESGDEESFSQGLLEYPHYTRPEEYKGLRVSEVLLSGDHKRVASWRRGAEPANHLAQTSGPVRGRADESRRCRVFAGCFKGISRRRRRAALPVGEEFVCRSGALSRHGPGEKSCLRVFDKPGPA